MRQLLTIALLALTTTVSAQDYSKMSWQLQKMVKKHASKAKSNCFTGNNRSVMMLAKGDSEALRQYSICHQGDIHIVRVPEANIAALSEDSRVKRLEASFMPHRLLCDSAAAVTQTNMAWSGTALPQAYDGTGVLVGNIDISHDYTHPAFRSTKDGRIRIVRAWDTLDIPDGQQYNENSSLPIGTLYTDTTSILAKRHSKDSGIHTHGTQTTAISAGSGWGTHHRGMAPEADIYMASVIMGDNKKMLPEGMEVNSDVIFLYACQNIFSYADSINQPCVINYSAGGNQSITGDDELFEQYCKELTGPGKIIVASAGNDGIGKKRHIYKNKDVKTVGGMITTGRTLALASVKADGALTMRIRNTTKAHEAGQTVEITLDDLAATPHEPDSVMLTYKEFSSPDTLDSMKIIVTSNTRYYDGKECNVHDIYLFEGNVPLSYDAYSIEFCGEGVTAEIFAQYCDLYPVDNEALDMSLPGGEEYGTINAPSSYNSIISVGATTWRTSFTNTLGEVMQENMGSIGSRARFSSTGPTLNGLCKPDVMAPGMNIASAFNSYYTTHPEYIDHRMTAETVFGGRTYQYYSDYGTSFSAPVVTGAIALWLQADPTLTTERIKEIITNTSKRYDTSLPYPNNYYGHGELNTYKGLLEILGMSCVDGLSTDALRHATVRPASNGTIVVTFDHEPTAPVTCRIYSTSGAMLKSVTLPPHSTTHTITLDRAHGIVAVQVGQMGSTLVRTL